MKEFYSRISDIEKFKTYLKSKYLNHFGESVKKSIFRTMWKFIFILENDECSEDRKINYYILKIIIEENIKEYINVIKFDKDYYLNINPSDTEIDFFDNIDEKNSRIIALIYIIFNYPILFDVLNENVKNIIKNESDKSFSLSLVIYYYFENDEKYIENIDELFENYYKIIKEKNNWNDKTSDINISDSNIDENIIKLLVKLKEFDNTKLIQKIINFFIEKFVNSYSYNYTEQFYYFFIKPCLKYFNLGDFEELFSKMNSNNQIYDSFTTYHGRTDIIEELKKSSKKYKDEINYVQYENLKLETNDDEDVFFKKYQNQQ
jgi:hypothetical protein